MRFFLYAKWVCREMGSDYMEITTIFIYKEFASCNFLGGDTNGFEVIVKDFDELNLEYRRFNFDDRSTLQHKFYTISSKGIEKIKRAISDNKEVFNVNSNLDNGSLDGNGQEFWFASGNKNRRTTTWNIEQSIDDGHEVEKEYLEEYGDNLEQEMLILKVFFEICNILKEEGITLDLYHFNGNEKLEHKMEQD